MDAARLRSAVLSQVNDEITVTEYGHGHLVTLPVGFYDDDLVTLFVERFQDGVRVTDQGTTAMRLHMADLDLDNAKVQESWRRSVASLGHRTVATDEETVAAWGTEDEVGDLLLKVAEAAMRVDQLRWLARGPRRARFRDQVVDRVESIAGSSEHVKRNARLYQSSGRERTVTAAVGKTPERSIYIQALGDKDQAPEHCYYIFRHSGYSPKQLLAVATGKREEWPGQVLDELRDVTEVAFFDQANDVRDKLTSRFALIG